MQFEEFDNRIKEAADHHHPAYDEQAWAKMEKLLNKHMPVKKDRRWGIVFFLLFLGLLLGGASYYYFTGKGETVGSKQYAVGSRQLTVGSRQEADGKGQVAGGREQEASGKGQESNGGEQVAEGKGQVTAGSKQQTVTSGVHSTSVPVSSANTNDRNTTTDRPVTADPAVTGKVDPSQLKKSYTKALQDEFNDHLRQQHRNQVSNKQGTQKEPGIIPAGLNAGSKSGQRPDGTMPSLNETTSLNDTRNAGSAPIQHLSLSEALKLTDGQIASTSVTPVAQQVKVPQLNIVQPAIAKTNKAKSRVRSTFFITASGGPDVSVVDVSTVGSVKLVGGAGLGYTFRNKFTLRTGFYTAHKVYTASPDQYHPPAAFWNYYPNLQKVEADCKVYEIPLLFSFNFANKSNSNWFAGTGISSYLMKKETYNYFYKTMAGVNTSRKYTLLDKNHHYFSVLTLSAGYSRSLGHGLSISAEPYLKVPLSGIGYGKINLNSAGVLFSAGWAPFHPKKAKPAAH